MNRNLIQKLLLVTTLLFSFNANSALITFTNCWSSCSNIGLVGADNTGLYVGVSLATLEYTEVAPGVVNFTLTNTIGNLYTGNTSTFISELFFGGDFTAGVAVSNTSSNIDSIDFTTSGFTNAALSFNWDTNLANSGGPGNLRLTNTETASWTLSAAGLSESNFFTPAMVHFQALPNGGSVKIINGTTVVITSIPEPESLLIFALGLFGLILTKRN